MSLPVTLLGLAILGLGAWIFARRLLRLAAGIEATLGAVVVGWSWEAAGVLVLGGGGWLAAWPLVGWNLAGLVIASFGLLRPAAPDPPVDRPRIGGTGVLAIGLALWGALVVGVPSLLFPVKVVSDGPIYHLYFAARWWQAGRIFLIATPFGESAAPYFPALGDCWLTSLFVLAGGDRIARIGQAPFLLAAALAAYSIARRLGASPTSGAITTSLFATITPLLLFSFEPNVDTIFVACYLIAVDFAIRARDAGWNSALLALAAVAAGGALGTKAPGIVFMPPTLAAIAIVLLADPVSLSRKLKGLAILALGPMPLGGGWYVRNAFLTGNPLYPVRIGLNGATLFPGWFDPTAMATSPYFIARADWRSFADILLVVFDPRLAPIWLFGLALGLSGARSTHGTRRLTAGLAVLTIVNVALFWLVVPYRTQQRFLLHATGLAAAVLAPALDRSRWLRIVAVGGLALHVLTPENWPWAGDPPWDLSPPIPNAVAAPLVVSRDLWSLPGGLIGMGAFGVAWLAARAHVRGSLRSRLVLIAGLAAITFAQGAVVTARSPEPILYRFPIFTDYLAGWLDLDARTPVGGSRIAYAGTNLPYYLMGKDFRNIVSYVNVDAHPGWLLHDYHREASKTNGPATWPDTRPGWDRLRPDYDAWLDNLRRDRIQLLVTTRVNPTEGRHNVADTSGFPIERVWADAHPEIFSLLHSDPLFRLYAVRSASSRL